MAHKALKAHTSTQRAQRALKAHTSTQRAQRALKAHTSTQRAHRALKAHTSTQRAHKALKAHTSTHAAARPGSPERLGVAFDALYQGTTLQAAEKFGFRVGRGFIPGANARSGFFPQPL